AAEGPMPQTKFVLSKALRIGLKPIVVINKVDRSDARPDEVINEIFDLFVALEASDEQLDFPVLYASGRAGWCAKTLTDERENLDPLFDTILSYVAAPDVDVDAPFSMLVTILDADPYLGRILTGRVYSGKARVGIPIKAISLNGEIVEQGRMTKLLSFQGIKRGPITEAEAGDIICIAGLEKASVADTIGELAINTPIPSTPIDPPTMAITISVNDSPLAGREGTKVTSRLIASRLLAEAETNVAISVKESETKDAFEVGGRGELQLCVLIENMRREGFEVSVSRPRVLIKTDPNTGEKLEPIEEVVVDVDEEYTGTVVEKISLRKGEMIDMRPSGGGKTRIIFYVPSRGLIGYQSEFMTDTRGTGVINRLFHDYAPYKGDIPGRRNGALISTDTGEAVAYAIWGLQERGIMFVNPQDKVYAGMIVGEHSRDNDLEINVLKNKQLTNIRTTSKDEAIRLVPPLMMTLEQMISYIQDDELVEVTPKSLRLRKRFLDGNERKRMTRDSKKSDN
ncbi:MAG: GTP-binding protein, partial [Pseudomonadota bacterium]